MSGCATAPPRAPPEIGHPAGRGYCAPSGAAGRMGPAQCPCLLRQREFPGRLRNGRFFESLPAMGTLPAPFGERFDAASAACAGRLAQRPAAPLLPQSQQQSEQPRVRPLVGHFRLAVVKGKSGCCGASLRSAPHHPAFPSAPLEPPSNTHMAIGTPPYRPSQAPRGPFSEPPTTHHPPCVAPRRPAHRPAVSLKQKKKARLPL